MLFRSRPVAPRSAPGGRRRRAVPAAGVLPGNPGRLHPGCDEDSVFPIRHFYQRWGAAIAIGRRPSVAARLHAAEQALADPDPAVRDQAVREAAEIVQAAYRQVAGG